MVNQTRPDLNHDIYNFGQIGSSRPISYLVDLASIGFCNFLSWSLNKGIIQQKDIGVANFNLFAGSFRLSYYQVNSFELVRGTNYFNQFFENEDYSSAKGYKKGYQEYFDSYECKIPEGFTKEQLSIATLLYIQQLYRLCNVIKKCTQGISTQHSVVEIADYFDTQFTYKYPHVNGLFEKAVGQQVLGQNFNTILLAHAMLLPNGTDAIKSYAKTPTEINRRIMTPSLLFNSLDIETINPIEYGDWISV